MRSGVVRHRLPGWVDPAAAYSRLYRDADASFWLDASDGTGRSWMGTGRRIRPAGATGPDLLDALRAALGESTSPCGGPSLGVVGWFAFELGATTVPAPDRTAHEDPGAPGEWLVVERAIEFDHVAGEVALVSPRAGNSDERTAWCAAVTDALVDASQPVVPPAAPAAAIARWRDSDQEYLAKIDACRAAIARGDAYQLCLTTAATVETREHPLDLYLRLRAVSRTHHGGLLRIGGTSLLSTTPEQFLAVDKSGTISTSPIKGTRRRGSGAAEDDALKAELAASDKERAENLMIVDLMRNDLAQVCEVGSVEVSRLLEVETYPHVHQLVSTVRGQLAEGRSALDAVAACFPAGSMTGAPKRSAMSILAELEHAPRGVYSGAFGYLAADGTADLAMVIRSIVLSGGAATVGAGGGITALSVPAEELAEVKLKAAALLAALGVR
jgi:para-aminobenzoate synthetase component 1